MLLTIIATIFVIGVLVFIHELGHFLVAKWAGIRVDKFSLGFPPTLVSRRWGETIYAVGVIPLGGFVKMAGENPDEETTGEPWEFMSKPVWKRALVIAAGPLMNFFLAILVLAGLYFVRGKDIDQVVVGTVLPDRPAAQAGIIPDDTIIAIDNTPVSSFAEMAEIISQKIEEPVIVTWKSDDILKTDTLITFRGYNPRPAGDSVAVGQIGIGGKIVYRRLGPIRAIAAGFSQSLFYVKMVAEFVWGLISQKSDPREIGGPILIGQLAGITVRAGFDILLEFLALLSVNLAVVNILPIPVFDGGHLVFLTVEKLKGSPLSLQARIIAQQIGIVFIIIFFIFVTFNDIARWF